MKVCSNSFSFRNAGDNEDCGHYVENGRFELYYDNSKKIETTSDGWKSGDNVKGVFGDGDDLQLYANGSNSRIDHNGDGDLRIFSGGAESIKCSEAGATHLFHNGTEMCYTHASGFKFNDNKKVIIGTGDDLQIWHDATGGNYSYIFNYGAALLKIGSDQDIILGKTGNETFINAKADGAVELYYDNDLKLSTLSTGVSISGDLDADQIDLGDAQEIRLGASQDLKLVHDGNNSYINHNGTGDFWIQAQGADENLWLRAKDDVYIQTNDNENAAKFIKNGKVELFYDGSSRLETNSEGVKIDGYLEMLDNKRIQLGTSDDLQLYSDGSDSYVLNTTDTDLIIKNNGNAGIEIINQNSYPIELKTNAETAIKCNANAGVALHYDGGNPKFETTSYGMSTNITNALRWTEDSNAASRSWQLIGEDGSYGIFELLCNNSDGGTVDQTVIKATSGGSVQLYHDNSEKLLTDANGIQVKDRITFGVSNNTVVLDFQIAGTQRGYINVLETGTTYSTSSDYRLKENEVSITDGIARLKTLKPYRFNFKDIPSKIVDGFFAHEVTPVVPEAVSGEKDGEQMQGMDYGRITPLLTAALQEAIGKIEILESKVAALEGT